MKTVHVDIPPEYFEDLSKRHPQVTRDMCAKLQDEVDERISVILEDSEFRQSHLIHESGHAWVARKLGIEMEWRGPHVVKSDAHSAEGEKTEKFALALGGVYVEPIPDDILDGLRLACAGDAAQIHFGYQTLETVETKLRSGEVSLDLNRVIALSPTRTFCEEVISVFLAVIRAILLPEMQAPGVREEILQLADEYERFLFGEPKGTLEAA
jgi:hypothetical protein